MNISELGLPHVEHCVTTNEDYIQVEGWYEGNSASFTIHDSGAHAEVGLDKESLHRLISKLIQIHGEMK